MITDYMHARYYNPNIARFLSVDPGRGSGLKVPQVWNRYAYGRGNPLNQIDPDGATDIYVFVSRTREVGIATLGEFTISGTKIRGVTLEGPKAGNLRDVARVPAGAYDTVREQSFRFGRALLELKGVPSLVPGELRTEIKFHPGSTVDHTTGCPLYGTAVVGEDKITGGRELEKEVMGYVDGVLAADEAAGETTRITTVITDIGFWGPWVTYSGFEDAQGTQLIPGVTNPAENRP
jgi:hypothetical protein